MNKKEKTHTVPVLLCMWVWVCNLDLPPEVQILHVCIVLQYKTLYISLFYLKWLQRFTAYL